MTVSASRRYPRWLLAMAMVEAVAVFGTGAALLLLINALSGRPTLQAFGLWLGLPILATIVLIAAGYWLFQRSWTKTGVALTLLPLALFCLVILWASI